MKKTWMYRALSTAGVASALLIPGAGAAEAALPCLDAVDTLGGGTGLPVVGNLLNNGLPIVGSLPVNSLPGVGGLAGATATADDTTNTNDQTDDTTA